LNGLEKTLEDCLRALERTPEQEQVIYLGNFPYNRRIICWNNEKLIHQGRKRLRPMYKKKFSN
jgi:hypothetical protein